MELPTRVQLVEVWSKSVGKEQHFTLLDETVFCPSRISWHRRYSHVMRGTPCTRAITSAKCRRTRFVTKGTSFFWAKRFCQHVDCHWMWATQTSCVALWSHALHMPRGDFCWTRALTTGTSLAGQCLFVSYLAFPSTYCCSWTRRVPAVWVPRSAIQCAFHKSWCFFACNSTPTARIFLKIHMWQSGRFHFPQ
jgi:hypothetical protein